MCLLYLFRQWETNKFLSFYIQHRYTAWVHNNVAVYKHNRDLFTELFTSIGCGRKKVQTKYVHKVIFFVFYSEQVFCQSALNYIETIFIRVKDNKNYFSPSFKPTRCIIIHSHFFCYCIKDFFFFISQHWYENNQNYCGFISRLILLGINWIKLNI